MKRIIILAVIAISLSTTSSAEAAGRRSSGINQRSSVFAKIMELERRKNAALMQMFFGR